jgi:hypothetical protein
LGAEVGVYAFIRHGERLWEVLGGFTCNIMNEQPYWSRDGELALNPMIGLAMSADARCCLDGGFLTTFQLQTLFEPLFCRGSILIIERHTLL